MLINPAKIGKVLPRLFTGSATEIIAELFQNSQRAGASRVDIATSETGFTYADNGEGINDLEGFRKLLTVLESDWDADITANQNPMGLGIQALLCNKAVTHVTFLSGDLSITIPTSEWLNDSETDWLARAKTCDNKTAGLKIEVTGNLEIAPIFKTALYDTRIPPQFGYEGVFQVFLNGEQLNTATPDRLKKSILETEYHGCKLLLFIPDQSTEWSRVVHQTVNWYGQLITKESDAPFGYYLEVLSGQPLTPMAPSRRGIVDDKKMRDFINFCQAEIGKHFSLNGASISPGTWYNFLFRLTPQERNEYPYTVGREFLSDHCTLDYDFDEYSPLVLIPHDPKNVFLNTSIQIEGHHSDWDEFDAGISTFAPLLKEQGFKPFTSNFNPSVTLSWKPGELIETRHQTNFIHGGTWSIGGESYPVGDAKVIAVSESNCWDCRDPLFYAANIEPLEFYKDGYAEAGYDPHNEDHTSEYTHEQYLETIQEEIRALTRTIPRSWSLCNLMEYAPQGTTILHIDVLEKAVRVAFSDNSSTTIDYEF